jgi:hypothetical protein
MGEFQLGSFPHPYHNYVENEKQYELQLHKKSMSAYDMNEQKDEKMGNCFIDLKQSVGENENNVTNNRFNEYSGSNDANKFYNNKNYGEYKILYNYNNNGVSLKNGNDLVQRQKKNYGKKYNGDKNNMKEK